MISVITHHALSLSREAYQVDKSLWTFKGFKEFGTFISNYKKKEMMSRLENPNDGVRCPVTFKSQ